MILRLFSMLFTILNYLIVITLCQYTIIYVCVFRHLSETLQSSNRCSPLGWIECATTCFVEVETLIIHVSFNTLSRSIKRSEWFTVLCTKLWSFDVAYTRHWSELIIEPRATSHSMWLLVIKYSDLVFQSSKKKKKIVFRKFHYASSQKSMAFKQSNKLSPYIDIGR